MDKTYNIDATAQARMILSDLDFSREAAEYAKNREEFSEIVQQGLIDAIDAQLGENFSGSPRAILYCAAFLDDVDFDALAAEILEKHGFGEKEDPISEKSDYIIAVNMKTPLPAECMTDFSDRSDPLDRREKPRDEMWRDYLFGKRNGAMKWLEPAKTVKNGDIAAFVLKGMPTLETTSELTGSIGKIRLDYESHAGTVIDSRGNVHRRPKEETEASFARLIKEFEDGFAIVRKGCGHKETEVFGGSLDTEKVVKLAEKAGGKTKKSRPKAQGK